MEFTLTEHGFVTQSDYGELHISPNNEYGFRPFQLMVASVAGCSGMTLKKILAKMRLDIEEIMVSVEVERNPKVANRIEKLHLHYSVKGDGLRKEEVEKAGALARKNCAMIQSIQGSVQVTESYEVVQ